MPKKHSLDRHSLVKAVVVGCAAVAACVIPCADAHALAMWFGSWDYILRHDAEDQPQAAYARLLGESESLLVLTCSRQVLESDQLSVPFVTAAVSQKHFLGRSDLRGRSTVYWFDGGSPEVDHWIYRDRSGQMPNAEQVRAFLDKLTRAERLVVELSNYRYETHSSEFRLNARDSKSVVDRFRKDCRDILGSELDDASPRR